MCFHNETKLQSLYGFINVLKKSVKINNFLFLVIEHARLLPAFNVIIGKIFIVH